MRRSRLIADRRRHRRRRLHRRRHRGGPEERLRDGHGRLRGGAGRLDRTATARSTWRSTATGSRCSSTLHYRHSRARCTQSHIHFGQKDVNGGIVVFFCTNLGNGPAGTPPCPQPAPRRVGDGRRARARRPTSAAPAAPGHRAGRVRRARARAARGRDLRERPQQQSARRRDPRPVRPSRAIRTTESSGTWHPGLHPGPGTTPGPGCFDPRDGIRHILREPSTSTARIASSACARSSA